ncbi:MAG: RsmE family RNA methyltransferase [Proteobacteria bacterium]|nr:RsmE family RNA methyltransferase [Pseudomonadota bacterium]
MRRFFLETLSSDLSKGASLDIPEELIHRIKNVLRINDGDLVEFIDGKGLLVKTEVTGENRNKIFKVRSIENIKKDKPILGLAVSLIRRERFDLLVEKAVELGVDVIIPIETEYSRPFGPESYPKLIERWQKIADQALSQCKRIFKCRIDNVTKIQDAINNKNFDEKMFFHFGGEKLNNDSIKEGRSHLFIIGPEGGFSPNEVDLFNKNNIKFYSLTDNILRTETAAFYVLSVANFLN